MTEIQSITADAKQSFTLTLPNGETATLRLEFKPLQLGWFAAVSYGAGFLVNSLRITRNQNVLDQFSNVIPFGLGCFTDDGEEPLFQQSFAAGRARLCLLDQSDMAALAEYYGDKI